MFEIAIILGGGLAIVLMGIFFFWLCEEEEYGGAPLFIKVLAFGFMAFWFVFCLLAVSK